MVFLSQCPNFVNAMKRIVVIISAFILLCARSLAQEVGSIVVGHDPTTAEFVVTDSIQGDTRRDIVADVMPPTAEPATECNTADMSMNLPPINYRGQVMTTGFCPYYIGGWYPWMLHKGLNLNLSASVFAGVGKHAYHGVGFAQNISAMYATQLTDHLSLAAGGYFTNVNWAHSNYHDAGLSAVLSYRFDEHWEAFAYAQKSLVDKRRPLPLYDISNIGDRIGIGAAYHFSPSFMISVSVEERKYPQYGPVPMMPSGYGNSLWSDMAPGFIP